MPEALSVRRTPSTAPNAGSARQAPRDVSAPPPWLSVVIEGVKSMHYGVVQIVVHDSQVVQIERTERTRFDVPQTVAGH